MQSVKGFTLIELVVTLVVLAIMTAIAAPSISDWIDSSNARSQANLYRDMLTYARSEAINRGEPVRVKRLADASWVVGTADPASCTAATALRCFPAPRANTSLKPSTGATDFVFTSQGQVRDLLVKKDESITFVLTFEKYCPADRSISLNWIGRIRSVNGACI